MNKKYYRSTLNKISPAAGYFKGNTKEFHMRYNFCIIYIDVGSPFQTYMNVVLVIIMLVTFIFFILLT